MSEKIDFKQYSKDRDIPDNLWNCYLRKYKHKYKMIKHGDGIWCILCKGGTIQPWSLIAGELLYEWHGDGVGRHNNKKRKMPSFCTLTQDCMSEGIVKFKEEHLEEIEEYAQIRRKKRLSDETLKKLREGMQSVREQRKPKLDC